MEKSESMVQITQRGYISAIRTTHASASDIGTFAYRVHKARTARASSRKMKSQVSSPRSSHSRIFSCAGRNARRRNNASVSTASQTRTIPSKRESSAAAHPWYLSDASKRATSGPVSSTTLFTLDTPKILHVLRIRRQIANATVHNPAPIHEASYGCLWPNINGRLRVIEDPYDAFQHEFA